MKLRRGRVRKLIERGDRFLEDGALDEAEESYREALAADPSSSEALYSIGCVASHRPDHAASLDWASRALALEPRHVGALNLAGNALLGFGRHAEALASFEAAEAVMPSKLTSAQIALCLEELGELEASEGKLRAVLEDEPGYVTRHAAVAMYSHQPFWADVHARLARVLQGRGNVEEARLHYHIAKRTDPLVELDPMYLEVMTTEELEDHPIDRLLEESWADHLDLEALGDSAEPVRRVLALTRSSGVAELEHAVRGEDREALIPVAAGLIRDVQTLGWLEVASRLRVVGDCLNGDDISDLLPAVRSPAWQRLLEIAERLHEGDWNETDALAAAAREGLPLSPELLVTFASRFVAVDAPSGLPFARVVAAALQGTEAARSVVESSILVGDAWHDSGDLAAAEAAFAAAVDRAEAGVHSDLLLSALDRLGRAQGERGRTPQAVATLTRHVAEARRVGETEAALLGRYNLAVALSRAGRAREAYETALEAALAVRDTESDHLASDVAELLRWAASEAGVDAPQDLLEDLPAAPGGSVESLRQAAGQLYESGRKEEALAVLDQAEAAARPEATRTSALGRILHLRGRILSELERLDEARTAIEAAIDAFPPRDAAHLLAAYQELAAIEANAGATDEAVTALEHALAYARRARSVEDEGEIRDSLAMLVGEEDPELAIYHYGKMIHLAEPRDADSGVRQRFADLAAAAGADPDRALEQMTAELAAVESPPDRRDVAFTTGVTALEAGRPALAEEPLLESLNLAAGGEWRDAERELAARQALGAAYRQTGRYSAAIEQYRSALQLAERLREEVEAAEVRSRLAIALRFVDDLDGAAAEYRRALTTFRRYDLRQQIAVNQMNFASTLFLLGRTDEGLDAALEALALFDEEGDSELALRTLALLAGSAAATNMPPELIERLHVEAERSGDGGLLAWSATEKGRKLLDELEVAGGERELERAIEIHRARDDRFNEAMSQLNRARLLRELDPTVAGAAAEAARQIATEIGQRRLATDAEEELLRLAVAGGDDESVERRLDSLVPAWTELRRSLQHDRDRIALADKVAPLLKLAAEHFLATRRFDTAFEVLDLARAQGLTDALVVQAEAPGRDDEAVERVRILLRSVQQPAVALTLDLVDERIVLGSLRADQGTPNLVDTGVTGAEAERLLETFRSEMLVYRGHGAQTWQDGALRLLAPAAGEVRDGDLVFLVLDGELQQLPLHAVGPLAGAPVTHVPSFAVLELSRSAPRSTDEPFSRFVSVGVSFPDEARAVGIALGGSVLSGRALDKDRVREAVTDATIVHFACHGFFDTGDFMDSGLLLATNPTPTRSEVLSLRDLAEWQLHADLVVLSACETGLGKVVPSDFLGLSRGILGAGARAVIVTLWPVEDAATQGLMLDLYRTMARQSEDTGAIDVAVALAATQRRFAETSRLYDWAAFKLVGWPELEWKSVR